MAVTEKQAALLMADLPGDAVKSRKGGGGFDLSYVDGFYVYDEMTKIFGPGGWGYTIKELTLVLPPHEVTTSSGKKQACAYTAVVSLWWENMRDDTAGLCIWGVEDVGYGSGLDRSAGAAIESAAKEAVTDAVKRCCRVLGRHMGLALYDKDQRYVTDADDAPEEPKQKPLKKAEPGISPKEIDAIAQRIEAAATPDELAAVKLDIVALRSTDEKAYKALVATYKAQAKKVA